MQYEKVHSVRDFYDGVRSGTADYNGLPHYFACLFDSTADDYSDAFQLFPVSQEFMERELQHRAIYRAWEARFHQGLASVETHPGHGGVDAVYDELDRWLAQQIALLEPLPTKQQATFRPLVGQQDRPVGVLRDLEVGWSSAEAEGR